MTVSEVLLKDLHTRLGFKKPVDYPKSTLNKSLVEWKMEIDDSPIFRYIYRNFRPQRHLEFGTWQGTGVLYCLEECEATVWTINLLQGEYNDDGTWAYGERFNKTDKVPQWAITQTFGENHIWYKTDALGFIGRFYLEAGLGHRVCQIYCDSRKWDISNYTAGFFDTVLIDGGHTEDIILSDTNKALNLLRSGGVLMWHDYCPREDVLTNCPSTRGVKKVIDTLSIQLEDELKDLFWINPSWILLGIKK